MITDVADAIVFTRIGSISFVLLQNTINLFKRNKFQYYAPFFNNFRYLLNSYNPSSMVLNDGSRTKRSSFPSLIAVTTIPTILFYARRFTQKPTLVGTIYFLGTSAFFGSTFTTSIATIVTFHQPSTLRSLALS